MSSIRYGVTALVLLPAFAAAAEVRCPDTHAGSHLVTATLFDGPLSEGADLVPDRHRKDRKGVSKSDWNVAYINKAGRRLHVECRYGTDVSPIVLEAGPVKTCTFTTDGKGVNSLACK